MSKYRYILSLILAGLYLFPGVFSHAQAYTSIVVIGDSLSDTGNDTAVSGGLFGPSAAVPSPATGYTNGRFTDGSDTSPAAVNYTGVWIEQLAAKLPAHPIIKNSLSGGTNYAYGFAFTTSGTSNFTYGPNNVLSFPVNNLGQQVSDYLATHPTITSKTLFVVWGGANDLFNATSAAAIPAAAANIAAIVQQLIDAGATDIIVPNLPPLGLVPRVNTIPATSAELTQASAGFNQALAAYLAAIPAANPGKTLHIFQLDVYTIFNTIVGPPTFKGFANTNASSQGNTTINPDTYLFWDSIHPTTFGHSILAAAAETLIGTPVVTTSAVTSSAIDANLNATVTLTANVTSTSGTAMGYVTFLDGTTTLGTVLLSGSTTTATATYTTATLTAGTHAITAVYTGDNGYLSSTSGAISEVVTAPAFSTTLTPSSFTLTSGLPGATTIDVTSVGGFSGTVALTCSTTAPHMSCSFFTPSFTFTGANISQSTYLSVSTTTVTAASNEKHGSSQTGRILAAFLFLPCIGLLGIKASRRRLIALPKLTFLLLFALTSGGALLGLTGCGGSGTNPNDTPAGTYSVLVTETSGTTVLTQTLSVTVVK